MSWSDRVADVAKQTVKLFWSLLSIFTEINKQIAIKLDELVDDLRDKPTS